MVIAGARTSGAALVRRTCLERPPHWLQKCGLSRQVVSGDRLSYLKYRSFCQKCVVFQQSRQMVSRGSGLSRQVSLYKFNMVHGFSFYHYHVHEDAVSSLDAGAIRLLVPGILIFFLMDLSLFHASLQISCLLTNNHDNAQLD